jgi:hypothetical protein
METTIQTDRRQRTAPRIDTSMPVRVQYQTDRISGWDEVSRLLQVSPLGAGIRLKHFVEVGRLLLMTMPLLPELRSFDFSEPQYKVWGVVRYINWEKVSYNALGEASLYEVGIAFVGKHPPDSYQKDPTSTYQISGFNQLGLWQIQEGEADVPLPSPDNEDENYEGRHDGRFMIPLDVVIEVINESGAVTMSESSVTENVSLTGAAVFTTLNVKAGAYVRMICPEYNISLLATVRARQTCEDGFTRLRLQFVDQQFPLQGIEIG